MRQERTPANSPRPKHDPSREPTFNFEAAEIEEKAEIVKKYNILDTNILVKRNGEWYMGNLPVDEWNKLASEDDGAYRGPNH